MAELQSTATVELSSDDFSTRLLRKCRESAAVKEQFFQENAGAIEQVCRRIAEALRGGHRLFVMGNGGSACDAMHVAVEFVHPIIEKRRAFPAVALTSDVAFLTAVGNDTDFSQIFSEQLKLNGRSGDVALGISTSGMSANVNYGFRRRVNSEWLQSASPVRTGDECGMRRVLPGGSLVQHSPDSGSTHDSAAYALGHGSRSPGRGGHHLIMSEPFALTCPLPLTERKTIVLGHGSGGRLSSQLINDLFVPAFDNPWLRSLDDQAVLETGGERGLHSPPILSWSRRCSFRAGTSAAWQSMERSMIWRWRRPAALYRLLRSFLKKACRWRICRESSAPWPKPRGWPM